MRKFPILLIVVLCAVLCAMLFACSGGEQSFTLQESTPTTVIVGDLRLQFLSPTLVRIETRQNGAFEDRASLVVTNRGDWDKVEITVEEDDKHITISTEFFRAIVAKDADSPADVRILDGTGADIWEFVTDTESNVFLPTASDELDSWYFCDTPRIIPSDEGYSLPEENYTALNGWEVDGECSDVFVFLPNGNYTSFLSDFIALTGQSQLISRSMLGYWDSRYFEYTEESAKAQVEDYLSRGYTLDVLVIDTDWRISSGGTGYDLNTDCWGSYEELSDFFEWCESKGISVVFNDHPEPTDGTTNGLDYEEIQARTEALTMYLRLGLDSWWYDRNWWITLNSVDEDFSKYAWGMYVYFEITEQANAVDDGYPERAIIMANVDGINNGAWAYASELIAHRYTLQWTGDISCDLASLAKEIDNAVRSGMERGLSYVSSDLGGHVSEISSEQYVRWIQYGALSSICRVHCTKPYSRMPWLYGTTAEEVTHTYVDMRYHLLAYLYQLAFVNYEQGLPIMRSLSIEYPQYIESERTDEYLLGSDILIAPVTAYMSSTLELPQECYQLPVSASFYNDEGTFEANSPVYQTEYSAFDLYWDSNASPSAAVNHDNFFARYSTTVQLPSDTSAALCFTVDDGIRVWVNNALVIDKWHSNNSISYNTPYYSAGSTLNVVVEYMELSGGSVLRANLYTQPADSISREVFLPDGVWMDVWTGERYSGPTTITTSNSLTTSPIFVREGSILPLVEIQTASSTDYSLVTLDVYPSSGNNSTVLYEDDGKTTAYTDGHYRSTPISTNFENNTLTLTASGASGEFDGSDAYSNRTWSVRVHQGDLGAITSATLNGVDITDSISLFAQDADSSPFLTTGAACDSNISQLTFSCAIANGFSLVLQFAQSYTAPTAPDYDDTAAQVQLQTVSISPIALYGNGRVSAVNAKGVLSAVSSGEDDGRTYKLTLKVTPTSRVYLLYLGGNNSLAKLTITDRAGNVTTEYLGASSGTYLQRYQIECSSDTETELYVTYSLLSGESIAPVEVMSYPNSFWMYPLTQGVLIGIVTVVILLAVIIAVKRRKTSL